MAGWCPQYLYLNNYLSVCRFLRLRKWLSFDGDGFVFSSIEMTLHQGKQLCLFIYEDGFFVSGDRSISLSAVSVKMDLT